MAQAAGVSPSQPAAHDAPPRTKGSVMATTLVGAHAFEHLYAHSIPIIILAIITEFELGALSVGAVVAIRSIFGGITSTAGGFLVDLFHHRVALVLSISTFMIGLGYLLMSIAPSYALILCALALGSMGSALWHPRPWVCWRGASPSGAVCSSPCTAPPAASATSSAPSPPAR